VELDPGFTDAWWKLGVCVHKQGRHREAIWFFEKALLREPDNTSALVNLGNVHDELGNHERAIEFYEKAAEVDANFALAYNNKGAVLRRLGRLDEAIEAFRKALHVDPGQALAAANLSAAIEESDGRSEHSVAGATIDESGLPASEWRRRGVLLREEGKTGQAVRLLEKASQLDPEDAETLIQLGIGHQKAQQVERALFCFERAHALAPERSSAKNALAGALKEVGRLEEALGLWEQAVDSARSPHDSSYSNLFFSMNYRTRHAGAYAAGLCGAWGERLAEIHAASRMPFHNDPAPNKTLKIGYVSGDFFSHPVAMFIEPVLRAHDRERFRIYCYSNVAREDIKTLHIRRHADVWRNAKGLSDDKLAEQIRRDGIDILVDLSGHTGGSRIHVFARKPAPVQLTYLGYPNTTGLPTMDYRISDCYADPPGSTEQLHSEQLYRLPGCFLCFQPIGHTVPVTWGLKSDIPRFTFGCFNNLAKIGPDVVDAWSAILRDMPEATLLLKNHVFSAPSARAYYEQMFRERGIASDRFHLMARVGLAEHLDLYNHVDVALDTFPYNGTTTTCEALWMGTPVITLEGSAHAGRVGVSLLSNVGLSELICPTVDDYVRCATDLARDRKRVRTLKLSIRSAMKKSPLMDRHSFTENLENAYCDMWQRWCDTRGKPLS
jgi:predicted O-linked N-acetylglucosamine transferase (SPINDLY family)